MFFIIIIIIVIKDCGTCVECWEVAVSNLACLLA